MIDRVFHMLLLLQMAGILFCSSAAAESSGYGISIGYGEADPEIDIYRIGFKKDFGTKWFVNQVGYLSGYFELSYSYWERSEDQVNVFAISPVFAYYLVNEKTNILPYIEAGIGGAYIDRTTIATRDLSSNFQFEDRIGIGVKYGSFDLNFRYMHYSNASLESPNDGIDIFMASASVQF